jgi:hypothetical protein
MEAFERSWNRDQGPGHNLEQAATAVELIGAGLIAMAGVVLALKLAFIAQLALLAFEVAQAIATAFATFGATTAEIPGFIAAAKYVCRQAINKALQAIEREIGELFAKAAKMLEKVGAKNLAADAGKVAERFGQRSAFHGLMAEVERANVSSPVNGANFYSGRAADGTRMRTYADLNTDGVNSVTLEKTIGGERFDKMGLYEPGSPITKDQADRVWSRLSERYAENAEGRVTAWTHDPWEGSVWNRTELPALNRNPKVTDIQIIDPAP